MLSTPRPLLTCQRCGLVHDILDLEGLKTLLLPCCIESVRLAAQSLARTLIMQRWLSVLADRRKSNDALADGAIVSTNEEVRKAAVSYRNEAGKNR